MTNTDSNDKIKAILSDAARDGEGNLVKCQYTLQDSLLAMIVIELKRIADHLAAISESGPR